MRVKRGNVFVVVLVVLLVSFVTVINASVINTKDGQIYQGDIVGQDKDSVRIQDDEGNVVTIKRSNIYSSEPPLENAKSQAAIPATAPTAAPVKTAVPEKPAEKKQAVEEKKTPAAESRKSNDAASNKTRQNALSISPFKQELSMRFWPSGNMGLDIAIGTDITPDNYIIYDPLDNYAEGQEFRLSVAVVSPVIENGTVNLNVNPGLIFGYSRFIWDSYPEISSINIKVSFVCNFEVEWFPVMIAKNLSLCSSAGIGLQVNSSAIAVNDAIQGPWKNSLILRIGSDFVINPVYLRYYF